MGMSGISIWQIIIILVIFSPLIIIIIGRDDVIEKGMLFFVKNA